MDDQEKRWFRVRAPAEEAGSKKAKPCIETPSAGIRLWAVSQRASAQEPQPFVRALHGERLCRSQAVGVPRIPGPSSSNLLAGLRVDNQTGHGQHRYAYPQGQVGNCEDRTVTNSGGTRVHAYA